MRQNKNKASSRKGLCDLEDFSLWLSVMIDITDVTETQLGLGWPCQSQVAELSSFPHSFGCKLGSDLHVLALSHTALALFPIISPGFEPSMHILCLNCYPIAQRSNLTATRTYFQRTYSSPRNTLLRTIPAFELFKLSSDFFWIFFM